MSVLSDKRFHIACAIDNSFVYPLAVMLTSCLETNKSNKITIHLFSAKLTKDSILFFEQLVSRYNQDFQFYYLEEDFFKGFPTNERISLASYYRIVIPERISPKVSQYLYLDADIVVTSDLTPLYDIKLNDYIFAAVNDVAAIDVKLYEKHKIPKKYLYFNAGVLLINRINWIQKNATHKVLDYLKNNHQICDFHDQDALNGALYLERKPLSPIWNQQVGLYFLNRKIIETAYTEDVDAALRKPVIVHFNGQEKPWHFVSAHPFKKDFIRHSAALKELRYREKLTLRKLIKRYIIYGIYGWQRFGRFYN